MDVIISIKPIYAKKIFQKTKFVEFRKSIFKRTVEKCYVYSTSPEKKIIGFFIPKQIVVENPKYLWRLYGKESGISKDEFFSYFSKREKGVAIVINEVTKFREPVCPCSIFLDFKAPQSFAYIDDNIKWELFY